MGRSMFGMDCIGLVVTALRAAGFDAPDEQNYPLWARTGHLREILEQYADAVPFEDALPGDLLLFRIGETEQHIGIYTGDGNMIHVYAQAGGQGGSVCEHVITVSWAKRIAGCYRWRA